MRPQLYRYPGSRPAATNSPLTDRYRAFPMRKVLVTGATSFVGRESDWTRRTRAEDVIQKVLSAASDCRFTNFWTRTIAAPHGRAGQEILRINPQFSVWAFAGYVPFSKQSNIDWGAASLPIAGLPE